MVSKQKQYKWFNLLLHKAYLDKGIYVLNYFKVLIVAFAFASNNVFQTFVFAGIVALLAYVVGRLWYKHKLIDTENEINNIFNPFQREVREKLKPFSKA